MEQEPISVRIARAKGCSPVYREVARLWECPCALEEHNSTPDWDYGVIDYLQPAASFALIQEMVEDCDPYGDGVELGKASPPAYRVGPSRAGGDLIALTLPEAVALAWLAWKSQG